MDYPNIKCPDNQCPDSWLMQQEWMQLRGILHIPTFHHCCCILWWSLFYGMNRNRTEKFRHIILQNEAGSYWHAISIGYTMRWSSLRDIHNRWLHNPYKRVKLCNHPHCLTCTDQPFYLTDTLIQCTICSKMYVGQSSTSQLNHFCYDIDLQQRRRGRALE